MSAGWRQCQEKNRHPDKMANRKIGVGMTQMLLGSGADIFCDNCRGMDRVIGDTW